MNTLKRMFLSLVLLLGCVSGCGGDDPPPPPQFQEDPTTVRLRNQLLSRTNDILSVPFETHLERFTPDQSTQDLLSGAIGNFQGLIENQPDRVGQFDELEGEYLDLITRKFTESREDLFDPIRERLIAENLYDSGPGFGIETEFAEDTAQGISDITTSFAHSNIDRRISQQRYQDALQRGDYTTMFNLALKQAELDIAPEIAAQNAQVGAVTPSLNLFGQLQQGDIARNNFAMQAYQADLDNFYNSQGNLAGLGTGLGSLAGLALALPTGGVSPLVGGLIGGVAGGGIGSLFKT